MKFSQIRRGGYLPDLIASRILSDVSDGTLKPGDALPTESALAESFGVSRNVVREAIARLRSDGVIETKQGRGACVLPPSARSTFRVDPSELNETDQRAQLFELRGVLEIDAAGLAADRRTQDDIDAMDAAIGAMTGQAGFDEKRLEADASFHRALGAATGNGYLASIMGYVSGRLKETTRATSKIYEKGDLLDITISEHRAILDSVQAKNSMEARKAMAIHIRGAATRLRVPGLKAK